MSESVSIIRQQLFQHGFRPLAVLTKEKRPLGNDWPARARQDPPECTRFEPVPHALNTGVLADGLRPIDSDVDDPVIANVCESLIADSLGDGPVRTRPDSPRRLYLYAAAEGEPAKRVLAGKLGKIEVLGKGQQFVAYGTHPAGVQYQWPVDELRSIERADLVAVTEDQITELFARLAPILQADVPETPKPRPNGANGEDPHPVGLNTAVTLLRAARSGDHWHDNMVRLVAHWVGRGWSNAEILAACHAITLQGYTQAQTNHDVLNAIRGARQKWDVPNVDHPTRHDPDQFPATPFLAHELNTIPRREWVYGHFIIKRFLAVLGAPGGTGKTAYACAIALSVALGIPLLGEQVHEAGPVWIYNLEDPRDELLRRIAALILHHRIEPKALENKLFLDSGRDRPLVIAEADRSGTVIVSPIVDKLVAELRERGNKLFVVDPFVKSHRVEENRNDQIDVAAALWSQVADQADCAILLLHHFRKGGAAGEATSFRGASALIDAARAAVSLATMTPEEADRLGIEADARRLLIRADNAKLNLAPPPEHTIWLRLCSVELPNTDNVQAIERWEPPSPWDGLSMAAVVRILDRLVVGPGDGEQYTLTRRGNINTRWAGVVVVDVGGLTEGQAAQVVRKWTDEKLLQPTRYDSPKNRKEMAGLTVDSDRLEKMRQQLAVDDSYNQESC